MEHLGVTWSSENHHDTVSIILSLKPIGALDYLEMYRRGAAKKDSKPVKKDVSDSDKYADLLVFGYACKLFRDDERALYHEHGKHLIPWMGDKSIMIDRSVEQT